MKSILKKAIAILPLLFIVLVFTGAIIILSDILFKRNYSYNNNVNLEDSITYYRDKYNNLYSKTSVIETDNEKLFLEIKSKDSIINRLQNLVSKYKKEINRGGSVTIIKDSIYIYKEKDITLSKDTIVFSQSVLLDSIKDKWIDATFGFNMGKSLFRASVLNDYEIIIGKDSKTKKSFVEVKNNNPYAKVNTLKTYRKTLPDDKKFGLGFYIGCGLNSDIKIRPSIGISLNYNIIEF
jgi:hypothetical protein